jgi:hypothetical protein
VTPVETTPHTEPPGSEPWSSKRVLLLAGCIFLSALAVHTPRLLFPMLWYDDFDFLRRSWTWQTACANLWVPVNEHAMPLNRLTTWVLVRLAGCASALPYVLALQGPLVLWLCMGLLYLFLRRELGHPVYGLVGMTLFGVTSQYEEALSWYAATFALVSLAFVLLGLLAAQRWRTEGRLRHLAACVFWVALAPTCFGGGVLAGPLCSLYLLLPSAGGTGDRPGRAVGALLVRLAPLLGTVVFLGVSLPRTAEAILHAEHHGGKTLLEVFQLRQALLFTGRSLVDNTLLGTLGITGVVCPVIVVPLVLAALLAAGVWWWRGAPQRSLLLLGMAFLFSSYLLIYGVRVEWTYERIAGWSRYQVFSHLGLTLFVAGGLPRWRAWLLAGAGRWAPTRNLVWGVALLSLWLTQIPRCLPYGYDSRQGAQLRRVDAVDARCRLHHISAAAARAVLPPEPMEGGHGNDNAWDLLRGSDDPRPVESAEVRRLLNP